MKRILTLIFSTGLIALFVIAAFGQTNEFNYQGNLASSGSPANGNYDLEFVLYDSLNGGTQVGPTLARTLVVTNGNFAVKLDFGPVYPGADRYLEIHVRPSGQGSYTVLSPRQLINATPYAVKAVNAGQLAGVTADQYVLTGDTRMTDARSPLPGSGNYVQNTTNAQANSNFNISGVGTAGTLNALTQFNLNGDRILSIPGNTNTFLGRNSGIAATTGAGNSFFGNGSGQLVTTGGFNSLFGRNAGGQNVTGSFNSYFGEGSAASSTGSNNSFFGSNTGFNNTTGNNITLVGQSANVAADGLTNATAIGFRASVGQSNSLVLGSINGVNTAVADTNVGIGTTTPAERLHVVGNGLFTGNLTVNGTLNGTVTNATTATNALSLGGVAANQYVLTGDTRLSDARPPTAGSGNYIQNGTSQQLTSDFNISGVGKAGTFSTATEYDLFNFRLLGTSGCQVPCGYPYSNTFIGVMSGSSTVPSQGLPGTGNSFVGNFTGNANTTGANNSFFGFLSGVNLTTGNGNSFFGQMSGKTTNGSYNSFFGTESADLGSGTASYNAGVGTYSARAVTNGSFNSFVGYSSGSNVTTGNYNGFFGTRGTSATVENGNTLVGYDSDITAGITNATAIGANAKVAQSNSLVLGSINGVNGATSNTSVGIGTTTPGGTLDVRNNSSSAILGLTSGNGSASLFLTRSSAVASQSAQIGFYSGGTVDFAMGTSQGSAGNSDFSIYNYGTADNAFTIQRSTGNIGIGTPSPNTSLHLRSNSTTGFAIEMENTSTAKRLYIGNYGTVGAGNHWPGLDSANTSFLYSENSLVFTTPGGIMFSGSTTAEHMRIASNGNVGIGTSAPQYRFQVVQTTPNAFATHILTTGIATGSSYGLVISAGTDVTDSALQVRNQAGTNLMRINGAGKAALGIGVTPTNEDLTVGSARVVTGLFLGVVGAGGTSQLCLNGSQVSLCNSSSIRYKTNIASYRSGLGLISQLRPVTFNWKSNGTHDLGLVAEEVEKVDKDLVFYSGNAGQLEGVRYDRISVVLINAVKEQQAQIEVQRKQIEQQDAVNKRLQAEIDALKKLVCSMKKRAAVCR